MMTTIYDELKRTTDYLEKQRDEFMLQANLLKADAKSDWEKLQHKLTEMKRHLHQLEKTTGQVADDISTAAKILGEEIKEGFEKIKSDL